MLPTGNAQAIGAALSPTGSSAAGTRSGARRGWLRTRVVERSPGTIPARACSTSKDMVSGTRTSPKAQAVTKGRQNKHTEC